MLKVEVGLVIGLIVISFITGSTFGILIMAWFTAASRADDVMEQER